MSFIKLRPLVTQMTSTRLMASLDNITVKHTQADRTFTIDIKDHDTAFLKYSEIDSGSIDLYTTVVPRSLEGKGIAKLLANAAFNFARENDLKIKPSCWYIDGYLKRHPQRDLKVI